MIPGVPCINCHKHLITRAPLRSFLPYWRAPVRKSVHVKLFSVNDSLCAFPSAIRGTHSSFDTDQSYDYSTEVVAPILLATPQQPELEAFTAHLPLPLSSPDPADSPGGQAEPPYRNHHTFDAMSNVATAARLSPLPQPPGPVGMYRTFGERPPHMPTLENDATSWEFSEQPRLTLTMYHEAMATRDTWISPEELTLWMHSQLGD